MPVKIGVFLEVFFLKLENGKTFGEKFYLNILGVISHVFFAELSFDSFTDFR